MSLIKITPESIGELLQELTAMEASGAHDDQSDSAGYDDTFYGYGEDTQPSPEPEEDVKEFAYGTNEDGTTVSLKDSLKIYVDRYIVNLLNGDETISSMRDLEVLTNVVCSLDT